MSEEAMHIFLNSFLLPEWDKLPDLGLYRDQVMMYIGKVVPDFPDSTPLTRSMINNYVKMRLVDAPEGKKYIRDAMAQLLMILELKQIASIELIQRLLHPDNGTSTRDIYIHFQAAQKECINHLPLASSPMQYALQAAACNAACRMLLQKKDSTLPLDAEKEK